MKSKIILIGIIFFCHKIFPQNCINGTRTDPNNPLPSNNNFKKNTFNWMSSTFPIEKSDYHNFYPYVSNNPLYNPFYSTSNYISYIAGGSNSDFHPEDGWELIKQDFGYIYSTSTNLWNGSPIATSYGYNKPLAYFILYNKYNAKLRILATTNKQGQITDDKILVTISLIDKNSIEYNTKSNFTDYKINGLFSNSSTPATPLDQSTSNITLSSLASYPSSSQDFFYVDFQLSYDPCICLFKSGLEVTFSTKSDASVSLTGFLHATSETLANVSNGSGSIEGDNPAVEPFFLQYLPDNSGVVKSVTESYANIIDLKNQMKTKNGIGSSLDDLDKMLKAVAVLGAFNPEIKEAVETASTVVDFLTVLSGEKESPPTAITGKIDLTGSINRTSQSYSYDFRFATPGSIDAQYRDEYTTIDVNGDLPYYPMYNESAGLFALLKTPHLLRKFKGSSNQGSGETFNFPNQITLYQLSNSDFEFAFNPIVDETETKIDAAYEVNGKVISIPGYGAPTYTNANFYSETTDFERIRTDFFPLECINKIIVKESSDFVGFFNDFNNASALRVNNVSAFIIFNIYYVFKVDAYGKKHYGVQTIKYPLIIDATSDDLEANSEFIKSTTIPNNLVINTTTYTNPNIIFSHGVITIDGDLINNSPNGGIIKIIGENGVNHISGDIGANIELIMGGLKEYMCDGCQPIAQQSTTELTTFCNSSSYKAKDLATFVYNGIIPDKNKYLNAKVFPNPTIGNFNLIVSNPEKQPVYVILTDLTGKVILEKSFNGYEQELRIETNGLSQGIYFVNINCGNQTKIEKLLIQNPLN